MKNAKIETIMALILMATMVIPLVAFPVTKADNATELPTFLLLKRSTQPSRCWTNRTS